MARQVNPQPNIGHPLPQTGGVEQIIMIAMSDRGDGWVGLFRQKVTNLNFIALAIELKTAVTERRGRARIRLNQNPVANERGTEQVLEHQSGAVLAARPKNQRYFIPFLYVVL